MKTETLTVIEDNLLDVGILPLDIRLADKEPNLRRVAYTLEHNTEKIDLLVLPELFSTGFMADADMISQLAEDDDGATITRLIDLARKYDVAIAGSYLSRQQQGYYNRGFIIKSDGDVTFYNKRHLFGISAESRLLQAGREFPKIVDIKGWAVALIVCYDLRFPVWCRRTECNDTPYDLLLVPANWPVTREYAWSHLLIARAIENQAVVIGADRSGDDEFGNYDNLTRVYDCSGFPVELYHNTGSNGLLTARLSLKQVREQRRRWPVAKDAECFTVTV